MVAIVERQTLRLVEDTNASLDRREYPRRNVRGQAIGCRLDHALPARQQPRLALNLRDLSAGGLAAVSDVPVLRGERLTVRVPRKGLTGGWDATGRVIRCLPVGRGYDVAIEFDPGYSAA